MLGSLEGYTSMAISQSRAMSKSALAQNSLWMGEGRYMGSWIMRNHGILALWLCL